MRPLWLTAALLGCNAITGVDGYQVRVDGGASDVADGAALGEGHLVFVSSEMLSADFGGDGAAADAVCQRLAGTAGRKGTFLALVVREPSRGPDLKTRLGSISGFVRVDGKYLAHTVDDLLSGHFHRAISLDENAREITLEGVWTGFAPGGKPSSHCKYWSSRSKADEGIYGVPESGLYAAVDYLDGVGAACNEQNHVYCVQTDGGDRPPPAPVAGKMVFITRTTASSASIADGDKVCQADADAVRTDKRTFKALVARKGVAASAVISPTAQYIRPSGALIGTGKALIEGAFDTGIWETADGAYAKLKFESWTWSGATSPSEPGSDTGTCTNWTSSSSTEQPRIGEPTLAKLDYFRNPNANITGSPFNYYCSDFGNLYCVEQ